MGARRLAVVALIAAILAPTAGSASRHDATRFPAAGEVLRPLTVRASPRTSARAVRTMSRFRGDGLFRVVLALAVRRGPDGGSWYLLSLPGRPNGARGWVPAEGVDVRPARNRITVHVDDRRIEVRRISDGALLLEATVAVGRVGAETPRGRAFYVQSAFVPTDTFYGAFALETSAYSRLTDWPDNGIVGIHGTDRPDLLGQAVSHGCIRVSNDVARRLRRLAPLGTPIDIL